MSENSPSPGSDIQADTVEIGGDVTGRDKIINQFEKKDPGPYLIVGVVAILALVAIVWRPGSGGPPVTTPPVSVGAIEGEHTFAGSIFSRLYFDQNGMRINLEVCADNLPGQTVFARLYRVGASFGVASQQALKRCVTFWDMDGAGPVVADDTYTTRAALNQPPDDNWPVPCFDDTQGLGFCDQALYPSTPTPAFKSIPFASPDNASLLYSALVWEPGSSEQSRYVLLLDGIELTAGPHTWPNFPALYFSQPLEGDFDVQVKLDFDAPKASLATAQMAGLVIRPIKTRLVEGVSGFPREWAVVAKYITDAGTLGGCRGAWFEYSSSTIHLRVERTGEVWRCAYSANGENWRWFAMDLDGQALSDRQLEMGLFAYSDSPEAITVTLADWSLISK